MPLSKAKQEETYGAFFSFKKSLASKEISKKGRGSVINREACAASVKLVGPRSPLGRREKSLPLKTEGTSDYSKPKRTRRGIGSPFTLFLGRNSENASSSKVASNCSEILSYMGGLDGEQKQLIKKLVNFRMKEGKRTIVRAMFYQTFHRPARTECDVIKLMVDAVEIIKPICEVEKVRIAGTIYDVPGIVAKDRQQTLAIRWILKEAFERRISYRISLEKCSFAEILDAYRKRGIAHKKRENLHGLSSTNRSFAHFRWWTPPFAKMCFHILSFSAQVVESLKGKSKGSPPCNELRDRLSRLKNVDRIKDLRLSLNLDLRFYGFGGIRTSRFASLCLPLPPQL
ncbi:hypothetical protein V6N13_133606 [Hibiscus sabdariffa]